jgi:hypothetical protein
MATTDFYAAAGILVAVIAGAGLIGLALVLLRNTFVTRRYRRRRREAIEALRARGMWPFDAETTEAYIRERMP